jgi:hypothetical protein
MAWPPETRKWWAAIGEHPLAVEFTATDWWYLVDTAVLHAAFWRGQLGVAAELRLRLAKFAATPEDRARLRIQFGVAEGVTEMRGERTSSSRRRPGVGLGPSPIEAREEIR